MPSVSSRRKVSKRGYSRAASTSPKRMTSPPPSPCLTVEVDMRRFIKQQQCMTLDVGTTHWLLQPPCVKLPGEKVPLGSIWLVQAISPRR